MTRRILCLFAAAFLLMPAAFARGEGNVMGKPFPRHEWRLGWGDMMYESAVYRNGETNAGYRHIGHFFGEYQYGICPWFGAGFEMDWSKVKWNRNGESGHNFFNLAFIPTARFTYYRRGIVTMYSGLGIGLLVNGGSEADYLGRKTVCAPVLNLTAWGISVNWKEGWFSTFEIGGLNSLNNPQEIFMAASRLFSISIGYRL